MATSVCRYNKSQPPATFEKYFELIWNVYSCMMRLPQVRSNSGAKMLKYNISSEILFEKKTVWRFLHLNIKEMYCPNVMKIISILPFSCWYAIALEANREIDQWYPVLPHKLRPLMEGAAGGECKFAVVSSIEATQRSQLEDTVCSLASSHTGDLRKPFAQEHHARCTCPPHLTAELMLTAILRNNPVEKVSWTMF